MGVKGIDHSCQGGTEPRDGVDQNFRGPHWQSHQRGGLFVAAKRIDEAAEARIVRDEQRDEEESRVAGCGEGNADPLVQGNRPTFRDTLQKERMRDAKRLRMDDESQSADEKHSGESDQKRRQLERTNQTPHPRPEQRSCQQRQRDGRERVHPVPDERRDEDACEGDHRPDGQINPARENHKGRANGGHAEERVIPDEIHQHAQRVEVIEGDTAQGVKRQENQRGGK